jgi:hypothetical protein
VPKVWLAAERIKPLVLRPVRIPRKFCWRLWRVVEHLRDPGPMPRLQSSLAMDGLPSLHRVVVARGLVRAQTALSGAKNRRAQPACYSVIQIRELLRCCGG